MNKVENILFLIVLANQVTFQKNTMRRLIVLFCLLGIFSYGVNEFPVKPETKAVYTPKLNKISESEIGFSIVSKERGYTYEALEITKEFEVKLDNIYETVEVGQIFINDYTTKKYNIYRNSSDLRFVLALPKTSDVAFIYTNSTNDGIYGTGFGYFGTDFIQPKEEIKYIKRRVTLNEKEYYKQEFIYNGRVGNAIKFIYREFINDYARPAFTQGLQYDLSESKIIGFRGLRVQIIKASNTYIEYKVLKHFDK